MSTDFQPDNSGFTKDERVAIQRALTARGFIPGAADGRLGPRTNAAIAAFKRSMGLVARSYIGPVTWEALFSPVQQDPDEMPPWIREAQRIMGWHEREDNRALRNWLASDGHALGDPSRFPWCGDFVETAIRLGLPNEPFPGDLGRNPYWALHWRQFGEPGQEWFGAPVSITRDGGGHVGFAVGENAEHIYVLGGNQNNRVSVAPIPRHRFTPQSWRWPVSYAGTRRPLLQMTGGTSTTPSFS